jgi:hypothetical protein
MFYLQVSKEFLLDNSLISYFLKKLLVRKEK